MTLSSVCLALAIYHESRGESIAGQFAVGIVINNRVKSKRFPDNVCDVVRQKGQFSFVYDDISDLPGDEVAWNLASFIADQVIRSERDLTTLQGAVYFMRAPTFKPYQHVMRIGRHNFYTESANGKNGLQLRAKLSQGGLRNG